MAVVADVWFTRLMNWTKFEFAGSFSIPVLFFVCLLDVLVVAKLNLTVVLEVNTAIGHFMERV
jgi:hypothetical protein